MLSENIRTLRKNKGFTQEDLASRLHVTRQTISKWELRETSPDLKQAKELSTKYPYAVMFASKPESNTDTNLPCIWYNKRRYGILNVNKNSSIFTPSFSLFHAVNDSVCGSGTSLSQ